jgi:HPt (histidine-containing phosphotransfer) domain-containing protein
VDEGEEAHNKDELQRKLRSSFIRNNQGKFTEIIKAIASGDMVLAHRLAHTLKGNAGQIGETALQSAAARIEILLKDGTIPDEDSIINLENELTLAFEELKPIHAEPLESVLSQNTGQIQALFEKLEPMLKNINPESVNLLDAIRAVPGAQELCRQIEEYDFESAAKTLAELKKEWS